MKKVILSAVFALFALTGIAHATEPCCDPPQECCDDGDCRDC